MQLAPYMYNRVCPNKCVQMMVLALVDVDLVKLIKEISCGPVSKVSGELSESFGHLFYWIKFVRAIL